jgi:uncharacterized damage-inducible protein DinB
MGSTPVETVNVYQWLEYDAWATAKLLDAVEQLSPQQFVHEFAGSFTSVRQQFVHLLLTADPLSGAPSAG